MRRKLQDKHKTDYNFKMLATAVYIPVFFVFIGRAMFIPFLPIYAKTFGVSVGAAGFIAGIMAISVFLFDLPAGIIIEDFGERNALIISTAGIAFLLLLAGILKSIAALTVILLLFGVLNSILMVGLLSLLRRVTAESGRGRKISSLGGLQRLGRLIGPVAGGFLAEYSGYTAVFFSAAGFTLVSTVLIIFFMPEFKKSRKTGMHSFSITAITEELSRYRKILATAGVVMIFLSLIRKAKQIVIPLWGSNIGLDASRIGLIIGIASAFDMFMFMPAGFVMDRFGRKYALGFSMLVLSLGIALLPLSRGIVPFFIFTVLISIGNGFGSGINMTFGADLAGRGNIGIFLGLWRQISDFGSIGAPLILGLITDTASLTVSMMIFAGIGFGGFVYMLVTVTETLRNRKGKKRDST
ncbi:MAG: MFS transporter [Spirochaetes bacterium]|nr:MFS transporter [Spirochaetota bacterium]